MTEDSKGRNSVCTTSGWISIRRNKTIKATRMQCCYGKRRLVLFNLVDRQQLGRRLGGNDEVNSQDL